MVAAFAEQNQAGWWTRKKHSRGENDYFLCSSDQGLISDNVPCDRFENFTLREIVEMRV